MPFIAFFLFLQHSIHSMVKHGIDFHVSLTSFIWNISTTFLCLLWHWHFWRPWHLCHPVYFNRIFPMMGFSEVFFMVHFQVCILNQTTTQGWWCLHWQLIWRYRWQFSTVLPLFQVEQYLSSIQQHFPYCSISCQHEMPCGSGLCDCSWCYGNTPPLANNSCICQFMLHYTI